MEAPNPNDMTFIITIEDLPLLLRKIDAFNEHRDAMLGHLSRIEARLDAINDRIGALEKR